MAKSEVKNPKAPDEVRHFEGQKGHLDVMKLHDLTVGRGVFKPGWKWSQHVKPIVGTQSCETAHLGYCMTGRMRVRMDSGEEFEIGPGDFFRIEPGHDAWVVGDEPVEMTEFSGAAEEYAKRREKAKKAGPEARPGE